MGNYIESNPCCEKADINGWCNTHCKSSNTWFCQRCLKDFEGDVRYCKECGLSLCEKCDKKEHKS